MCPPCERQSRGGYMNPRIIISSDAACTTFRSIHDPGFHAKKGGPVGVLLTAIALSFFALSPLSAQVEPAAGSWHTWVISNVASGYRLPPPPSDSQTRDEAKGLKDVAGQRDDPAIAMVRFWDAGAPPY